MHACVLQEAEALEAIRRGDGSTMDGVRIKCERSRPLKSYASRDRDRRPPAYGGYPQYDDRGYYDRYRRERSPPRSRGSYRDYDVSACCYLLNVANALSSWLTRSSRMREGWLRTLTRTIHTLAFTSIKLHAEQQAHAPHFSAVSIVSSSESRVGSVADPAFRPRSQRSYDDYYRRSESSRGGYYDDYYGGGDYGHYDMYDQRGYYDDRRGSMGGYDDRYMMAAPRGGYSSSSYGRAPAGHDDRRHDSYDRQSSRYRPY